LMTGLAGQLFASGSGQCDDALGRIELLLDTDIYNPTAVTANVSDVFISMYLGDSQSAFGSVVRIEPVTCPPHTALSATFVGYIHTYGSMQEVLSLITALVQFPAVDIDGRLLVSLIGLDMEVVLARGTVYSSDSEEGTPAPTALAITPTILPTGGFPVPTSEPTAEPNSTSDTVLDFLSGNCICLYECSQYNGTVLTSSPTGPTPPPTLAPTHSPTESSALSGICCTPNLGLLNRNVPDCVVAAAGTCNHTCGEPCGDSASIWYGHESGSCSQDEMDSSDCTFFRPGLTCDFNTEAGDFPCTANFY